MKALTGNRLDDGEVVFWAAGGWVLQFQDAELFSDPDLAAAAEGEAKTQTKVVVDPYLIDLIESGEHWAPLSYRERLRALGPTNHLGHGKQVAGGAVLEAIASASGAARSTGRVNLIKRK